MRSWGVAESSHRAFAHWFHVGVGLRLRVPGAEVEQRLPCVQAWTATAACCRHCAFDLRMRCLEMIAELRGFVEKRKASVAAAAAAAAAAACQPDALASPRMSVCVMMLRW